MFVNDGYHVEHHAHPGVYWTRLTEFCAPQLARAHGRHRCAGWKGSAWRLSSGWY
ncbi:MAG: hypothetical protein DMG57_31525 [Acidobacteria bacterium]|nr:MAG: hypothetical protein DMG57_31525 [Acidobacteriota bacterium]